MFKMFKGAALAASAVLFPMFAHAAAVDVDDVVTEIGLQVTPVAAVGGAVLALIVAVKTFKWVRTAL